MESTIKKRYRTRKTVNEDNVKRDQENCNKKIKVEEETLAVQERNQSPVADAAHLLNETVPEEGLSIKLEFEENPETIETFENILIDKQLDHIKSKPNSPSRESKANEDIFEYLDTPYMSRADMVLNMAPITEEEEETYAELYEDKLMDATNQYDLCNDIGDCMYEFSWWSLPNPPKPYEKRYMRFGDVKYKDPTLKDKVGPIKEFTIYEAFTEIWSKEVMEIIVFETNNNGKKNCDDWIDTSIDEMYVYLAITLAANMDAREDLNEYWQNNSNQNLSTLSHAMTYNRFVNINKSLSFSDVNADISNLTESQAAVFKIKPIMSQINNNCRALYQIGQNIVFDEPYDVFKRNGVFIKRKKTRGIKEINICDAETAYTRLFVIRAENNDVKIPPRGISPLVILKFMQANKDKGYSIWCNNIFNSPLLVRAAYVLNFNFVGTIGITDYIESNYVKKDNLKDGEVTGATCEDMDYILWQDKVLVTLVSTYHGKTTIEDNGRTLPAAFVDFKKNVASLDIRDQILADYVIETEDWVRRMFNRLLNITVFNCSILTKQTEQTSVSHREFRQNLIQELISRHATAVQSLNLKEEVQSPENCDESSVEVFSVKKEPELFQEGPEQDPLKKGVLPEKYWEHYPEEYGIVPGKKRQKIRKPCIRCHKPSQTMCPACRVPLCLSLCHRLYHSTSTPTNK